MSSPVLTIRPEPGCTATVAAGREMGLAIRACPLSEIRPLAWQAPDPGAIDALLFGSANAVRHAGAALDAFRGKPAYAVGDATAAAAEAAGFRVAGTGPGVMQPLLDAISPPQRLLRITGVEHVAVAPPPGIAIETRIAYENAPLPLPDAVAQSLREGAIVLLHSAVSARHFAAECDRLEVPRCAVRIAALGHRIAAAAGNGWRELRFAEEPHESALLALARDMCHHPPEK